MILTGLGNVVFVMGLCPCQDGSIWSDEQLRRVQHPANTCDYQADQTSES